MSTVTMDYGSYNFSPVPLVRISHEHTKSGDGNRIGTIYKMTLTGTLVNLHPGGLSSIMAAQDDLKNAMTDDGRRLRIQCDESDTLACYPRILAVNFDQSDNNWVYTCPYTIELEFDSQTDPDDSTTTDSSYQPPYVSSVSEEWQLEFVEDKAKYSWTLDTGVDANPYQLRLTHTINATGKMHYGDTGLRKPAWQEARDYVISKAGYDATILAASGTLNINSALYAPYNHMRTNNINEADGTFSLNESWLVINPSGTGVAGRAIEDFTVTYRKAIDKDLETVGIEGSIQGLESKTYGTSPTSGFSISETKYDAARLYYSAISSRLYYRCKYAPGSLARTLNTIPVNVSVGHNPTNGTITYNYEYNNRLSNCITGALTENIMISDNNPTDIFATLTVLGRTNGPILQSMGTVTAATREVSIECVMGLATGCPTNSSIAHALIASSPKLQVKNLLCAFQADLQANYGYVLKSQDTERWEPKEGRYARQVTWTYQQCSGVAPTLC